MEEDLKSFEKLRIAHFKAYKSSTAFSAIFNMFFFLTYLDSLLLFYKVKTSPRELLWMSSVSIVLTVVTTFFLKKFKLRLNRRGVYGISILTILLLVGFIVFLLNL